MSHTCGLPGESHWHRKFSSPGKTAVAAKLPRIYCRSSITEWPYFLGNIAVPQENLSHASYTSKWVVKIQEPPKTVIRSYFKSTIAYTDCNTNPLVSCSGTCLSHQLIDHGHSSDIDVHQSTPQLSLKRIVLILLRLSAICRQVRGLSYYSCSSEDAFARTRERQNAFPGNMVTLLYWSDSILGNFTAAMIFPDKGIKKNSPPFSCHFFPSSSLTLLTC